MLYFCRIRLNFSHLWTHVFFNNLPLMWWSFLSVFPVGKYSLFFQRVNLYKNSNNCLFYVSICVLCCYLTPDNKRLNTQQILDILHIYKTCKSLMSLLFIHVAMTNVTLCYSKQAPNNRNAALTCTVGGPKPCVRDMSWVSIPFKKRLCVCCSNWPCFICIVSIFHTGVDVVKLIHTSVSAAASTP